MKLVLSVWFVYGTFYLDSPIHTELYLTNDCESAYEQIIQKKAHLCKNQTKILLQRKKEMITLFNNF